MTDVYDTTNWKRLPVGTPVFPMDEAEWYDLHFDDQELSEYEWYSYGDSCALFIAESERDQYRCAAQRLSVYAAKLSFEYERLTRIVWGVQRALMDGG